MPAILKLRVTAAEPIRRGQAYVWGVILELTQADGTFRYPDLIGVCRFEERSQIRALLHKLEVNGAIDRLPKASTKDRIYRLLKRQSECPMLTADGKPGSAGRINQQMWNVMRRARGGFTVDSLALDASTDDIVVARNTAKQYCLLLCRAGLLKVHTAGERGVGRNIYVLTGSGNTGPKPPKKLTATVVWDQNRNVIVGDVVAEEAE